MKYGVNSVTLVGNVGEIPRVTERDGEAFVANFPLATNEFYKNKEGEEISKTERHQIVNLSGTFISITKQYKTQKNQQYMLLGFRTLLTIIPQ